MEMSIIKMIEGDTIVIGYNFTWRFWLILEGYTFLNNDDDDANDDGNDWCDFSVWLFCLLASYLVFELMILLELPWFD